MAWAYEQVAILLWKTRRTFPGSRAAREQGLAIRKRLADDNPDKLYLENELSKSYEQFAIALQAINELPAARKAFEEGFEIAKRLAVADKTGVSFQERLVQSFRGARRILARNWRHGSYAKNL